MILIATVNKLLRARGWYSETRPEPNMLQWLELVALATVCDVVPLKGLNRAYVTQGLKIMSRRENMGLAMLSDNGFRKALRSLLHILQRGGLRHETSNGWIEERFRLIKTHATRRHDPAQNFWQFMALGDSLCQTLIF